LKNWAYNSTIDINKFDVMMMCGLTVYPILRTGRGGGEKCAWSFLLGLGVFVECAPRAAEEAAKPIGTAATIM